MTRRFVILKQSRKRENFHGNSRDHHTSIGSNRIFTRLSPLQEVDLVGAVVIFIIAKLLGR